MGHTWEWLFVGAGSERVGKLDEPGEAQGGGARAKKTNQDRMIIFVLVQRQKKVSIGELLLFGKSTNSRSELTIYLPNCFRYHLRIGEIVFPGLTRPGSRGHRQPS